jgi:Glycosyl hydrolase family 20, catalytic domain/Glycosyl hydrolase family 20, domain 2
MNRFFLASLAVLVCVTGSRQAMAANDPADTHPELHLIPWPKSLTEDAGHMRLTSESRIVVGDDLLKPLAEVLSHEVAKLTGLKLNVALGAAQPGDIVLKINKLIKAGEPILELRNREPVRTTDGAHTIVIREQAVIEGFDYRATAEGTSTILQLLGKAEKDIRLPKVTIKDWPHADYCGVMLDVARQDHPIEAIKKVVQLCRLYKARYLQLHLTDDQGWTFPSTKYPTLGSKNHAAHGGIAPRVYKLDELKELVAYADSRGVTLVPELEVPGHSGAASRSLPEIFDAINPQSKQPVGMGCMNMSNEDIYPALDTIIGEMCDVFRSSPYFHIGSDEVTSGRLSLHPGYKDFMAKHGLKNDQQLADHFIASVCEMVKKHDKKAIKWEGLSNTATKDVIIMGWELNSTVATDMLARGYTTITVPWTLAVPWEQWNMYVCNGSRLKKGDSVLGAMLVAWEQPPLTHITNLRNLPSRQERTWGPDNPVTVEGFASRFQPLDAVAGKLIDMPPKPQLEAAFTASAGTSDFLDPVFAFDGNDATFYKSAVPPKKGDHFTMTFPEARQVYAIEVLTGINRKGLMTGGEVQVSSDGKTFATVATLNDGVAKMNLKDNRVQAVRIRAASDQSEQIVVRAINLRLLVEVSGVVRNPGKVIGEGNVAVTKGDTEFAYPIGTCSSPIINRDHTLKLNNGGNAFNYSGPITGSGTVEIHAGGGNAPMVFDGKAANTMSGTWKIAAGHVVLAKEPGIDAMAGTILVGGSSDQDSLILGASNQINDAATLRLLPSDKGGASFNLNGFSDTIARLTLAPGTKVLTDGARGGGVLTVRELTVDGKSLPRGIYTSSSTWLQGGGYVIVADVKRVDTKGIVVDPNTTIGAGNMAVLKAATTFRLRDGDCAVAALTGDFPLTLNPSGGKARFNGFITGGGSLRIEATTEHPLEIAGEASNSFKGTTTLVRGTLKLGKPANAIAIPGNLESKGAAVIWEADGQIAASAVVSLEGTQPSRLDLNGHKAAFSKLMLSKAALVHNGKDGALQVKQLFVDGKRLKDGTYRAPQSWLEGTGTVTVDSRVDVRGTLGSPEVAIGVGNIGNLTGDTKIGYPSSGGDFDIATNGFTLKLDSGDGNAFAYSGSISGTGNVEFFMGPSYTGFRDAPMLLNGSKPNTATGKFLVKKGRVQLEKPAGVVAISGDVTVGGQGFNDCLFWKNSHQLKDTVNITLLDAGNNGAAYLHLNGCQESASSLTMTANNKILTDSVAGTSGVLTVKSLSIGGIAKPAGTYSAATEKWIEGKGKVIVSP